MPYIIALDQGTTSSRAIVFDHEAAIVAVGQREFRQIFPRPGWVEHDPGEIWATQISVATEALGRAHLRPRDIAAIGITNQRETTVVWDRETGQPVYNAIVWQDRRTADFCDRLKRDGHEDFIRERTGLVIDAYFSGSKVAWILDNVPGARARAEAGKLAFGTIDSWLVWQLTSDSTHITDVTNASRTMLFNINTLTVGRGSAEAVTGARQHVARGPSIERGLRPCLDDARAPAAFPSPASPATSRRPCSARCASPPG